MNNLTRGAVSDIHNGVTGITPAVQLVDLKRIVTSNNTDRYRVVVSDGEHFIPGMLATQMAEMVTSGAVKKYAVIQLEEFACNSIGARRVCIIVRCSVKAHANGQIGQPVSLVPGGGNDSSPNRIPSINVNQNQNQNQMQNNQNQNNSNPNPSQNQNQQQNQSHNQNHIQGNQNNQNQNQNQNQGFGNNMRNQQQQRPRVNGSNNNNFNNRNRSNNMFRSNSSSNRASQFQPIATLNPYQNSWRIKVRVTQKNGMKNITSKSGDQHRLFSIDLLDSEGTEILATMWNADADHFWPIFEENGVYLISRGRIGNSKKQYTRISNEYSITLGSYSDVTPCEDDRSIAQVKFNFLPFSQLNAVEPGEVIDVLAVVARVQPLRQVQSQKQERSINKRVIDLVDSSAKCVELTLWAESAEKFDEDKLAGNPVIVVAGAKVSAWGGRSLVLSGNIRVRPQFERVREVHAAVQGLERWWQNTGARMNNNNTGDGVSGFEKLTRAGDGSRSQRMMLTVGEAQERLGSVINGSLGIFGVAAELRRERESWQNSSNSNNNSNQNQKDNVWFETLGTISTIVHNLDRPPWYKACPDPNAVSPNAKVAEDGRGSYYCDKDGKTYSSYIPRYILRFCVQGSDGQMWMTAFGEAAESIVGLTAAQVEAFVNEGRNDEFERVFRDSCFKRYLFKVKARPDNYQDEQRVRYDCNYVMPMDYAQQGHKLCDSIEMLMRANRQNGPDAAGMSNNNSNNINNNNVSMNGGNALF